MLFELSAEVGGESINRNVITGCDLTNWAIGELI